MNIRNEIKAHIVQEGTTMSGYDIIWQKRGRRHGV